jgi:O-antigen ligase
MFQSSPIHGLGFGAFHLINDRYIPKVEGVEEGLEVHNIYLELLAETGLVGFLAFLALIGAALSLASKEFKSGDWLHRTLAFAVLAGTASILFEGLFDHYPFWSVQVGSLLWVLFGLLLADVRNARANWVPA